jgi:hypothetical protein
MLWKVTGNSVKLRILIAVAGRELSIWLVGVMVVVTLGAAVWSTMTTLPSPPSRSVSTP